MIIPLQGLLCVLSALGRSVGLLGAKKQVDWARTWIHEADKRLRERRPSSQDSAMQRGKARRASRQPYSMFLSEPFVKVGGLKLCCRCIFLVVMSSASGCQ